MLSMKSLLNAPGDGLMKHLREECVCLKNEGKKIMPSNTHFLNSVHKSRCVI